MCAKKLAGFDEDSHNLNGVGDFFIDSLYRWQENTSFHNIYRLPELGMSVARKTSQAVFFDDRYIYMKDSFFKQIASPLLNTFQVSVLKKALVDDGILCPDKSDTYTVKVGYYNIAGQFKRERMLRFSRNRLEKTGEPGFVEICLNSKQNRKKAMFRGFTEVLQRRRQIKWNKAKFTWVNPMVFLYILILRKHLINICFLLAVQAAGKVLKRRILF